MTPDSQSNVVVDVDVIINCYERTYRQILTVSAIRAVVEPQLVTFRSIQVLINNVNDHCDAVRRANLLMQDGVIGSFTFVQDVLPAALANSGLRRRHLRRRPYFLNYGIAMSVVGDATYVLGWDAEVTLDAPNPWLVEGVELLARDAHVFSCSPRWPDYPYDTLAEETFSTTGPWALNWGFSDQAFLVRRAELASPIYRRLVPAALARHSRHPRTFEARLEAHQRASRRPRATHSTAVYSHNDLGPVLTRLGDEMRSEVVLRRALAMLRRALTRLGSSHPSLKLP